MTNFTGVTNQILFDWNLQPTFNQTNFSRTLNFSFSQWDERDKKVLTFDEPANSYVTTSNKPKWWYGPKNVWPFRDGVMLGANYKSHTITFRVWATQQSMMHSPRGFITERWAVCCFLWGSFRHHRGAASNPTSTCELQKLLWLAYCLFCFLWAAAAESSPTFWVFIFL